MHDNRERNPTMGEQVNRVLAYAQCLAMPLELFLRKPGTAGERYFGGRTCIGIFLMLVVIGLVGGEGRGVRGPNVGPNWFGQRYEEPEPPPFMPGQYEGIVISAAFYGTVIMLLVHKAQERKNAREGKAAWHSAYTGESWLDADDWKAKLNKEPALAFLLGLLSLVVSPGLGAYLIVAAFCLGVTASMQKAELAAKKRAMRDAQAEQQMVMGE